MHHEDPSHGMHATAPVLVMGATGYVGSRLVPRLLEQGHHVRAMGRSRPKLQARAWAAHPHVALVEADVGDTATLQAAMRGASALYYLVHSMESHARGFEDADRRAARRVAKVAAQAGVQRIVYLGGMGDADDPRLSPHLRSRQEVGRLLRSGDVPVTELRAGIILGAGSASYEILRYLTERLPVMVTPRWVSTPAQPIAIRDVLGYLVDCLRAPETVGGTFEIGGPEVLSYRRLMEIHAEEAGLRKRLVLPVGVLTPRLSSYWIHLVTPAPASLARPLAEGLRNPVVVKDDRIRRILPRELLTPREAIRLALDRQQHDLIESHWTDASGRAPAAWSYATDAAWTGGTLLRDERSVTTHVPPEVAWTPIERIGGTTGYYYANGAWRLRGALDKMLGGVGLRRGRAYPTRLRTGDALDFWRVADVEPGRRVRLVAEMKVPGRAMLEFAVQPDGAGSRIRQTALFLPRGLAGLAYWYALLPVHNAIFRGMLAGIAREAARAKANSSR